MDGTIWNSSRCVEQRSKGLHNSFGRKFIWTKWLQIYTSHNDMRGLTKVAERHARYNAKSISLFKVLFKEEDKGSLDICVCVSICLL
mmetsp:Transcript_34980/g.51146  ORF Transcript_34980/g.51146 Transcript_34980/m.51146 type:complete len:87 (+) Transcript_34980:1317-1577(+)